MFVTGLSCWACGTAYAPNELHNLCTCGKPLRVDYDLAAAAKAVSPASTRRATLEPVALSRTAAAARTASSRRHWAKAARRCCLRTRWARSWGCRPADC